MTVQQLTSTDVLLLGTFVFLLVRLAQRTLASRSESRQQPPGPKGRWFFGNAFEIPKDRQWLKFDEWIRKYGDVVQIDVTGQPILILGSVRVANELLDMRGSIYSDRPSAVMAGELVGWNKGLGYASGPRSPRFREFRRLFNEFIGRRRTQEPYLLSAQEKYAGKLLQRLANEPSAFFTHIRQSTGALLLRVAYGYDVASDVREDPLVTIAEVAMHGFSRASEPGAFLVDTLPWLKYLPAWIPGADFQVEARRMWEQRERLYDVPFDFVKNQMAQDQAAQSFVQTFLASKSALSAADEDIIKAAAASLYSGGVDSTPSSLCSFILAMTLHPEIQARAQAEIDSVLGRDWRRLPSFEDKPNLPYVNAIALELLRWNLAVPLGLPHMLTQDDVYRGYLLRKGTVVWANIWSMLHDETVFPEPSRFRPERYLDDHGALRTLDRSEDPAIIAFGFGRRICPGMFLAQNSIFIAICMMLYVFDISMAVDDNGEPVVPEIEYRGFMSYPQPFQCKIAPRSPQAEDLIRRANAE